MAGTKDDAGDAGDDAGSGQSRRAEPQAPRRPYATIDVAADRGAAASSGGSGSARHGILAGLLAGIRAAPRARLAAAAQGVVAPARRIATPTVATHAAAGAVGALLVLLGALLLDRRPSATVADGELSRRIAELQTPGDGREAAAALGAKVDQLSRTVAALGEAQAALGREGKVLAGGDITARLARLEEGLAAAAPAKETGQPQQGALVARLAQLEKSLRETSDRVTEALSRLDAELAAGRADTGRLADKLGALRQETEQQLQGAARVGDVAPILARLAAMDKDLKVLLGGEVDRAASATRLIVGLELSNLKRAIDRGDAYATELVRLRKTAGNTLDVTALERHMRDGAPSLQDLAAAFPAVANAMLDAEQSAPDASLLDRLLAGARSVVHIRKIGHASGDNSAEAVIERMQTALRQGRLGEALEQAKALPPRAARAGEEWIGRAQTRLAVDAELSELEAAVKASLAASAARDAGR
jgi:hypothetical protein